MIPVQSMEDQSNMHYQVLTSSYPVSPPHSPTSLYKFVQNEEPSTHAPVLNNNFTPFSSFATTSSTPAHNDICPIAQTFSNSHQYNQQQQQDGGGDKKKKENEFSLSKFQLIKTVGTGSFGRVYISRSKINQQLYAIKVLKKQVVVQHKQVEHTNNERKVLMAIHNPFCTKLWGTFQDNSNLYMVMEYIAGGELFTLLRKYKKFNDSMASFYAAEVLLALAYLHSLDIVYR
ncbi:kinase-like domain-containing protein, partial [Cunninghamella echinulata]